MDEVKLPYLLTI